MQAEENISMNGEESDAAAEQGVEPETIGGIAAQGDAALRSDVAARNEDAELGSAPLQFVEGGAVVQDDEPETPASLGEAGKAWLAGAIEAMLFVTDEPVGVLTFADMLEADPADVQEALVQLQQSLEQSERGIQLREVAGGWRLYTHPRYHELIERYVVSWDTRKLSQAALETLAVVAYCQPITRNGVASVRGVSSDSSINSLVEKGLLREAGTQDAPGNPVLYATTRTFLEKFGLRSVKDLPPLESFAPDEETRAFIAERLNVVRPEDEAYTLAAADDEDSNLPPAETMQEAMQQMLSDALAQGAGAVEKINFDELVFDEDD